MLVPQQEPTMEEILAAVRAIVSEDNPPNVAPLPPDAPPSREPADGNAEEIIFERRPPEARGASANDIFSVPDDVELAPTRRQDGHRRGHGSSVESVFERAVRESFEPVLLKHLGDNSQPVIEGMKPLIREWMDENFPALLEKAIWGQVEQEIKARTR